MNVYTYIYKCKCTYFLMCTYIYSIQIPGASGKSSIVHVLHIESDKSDFVLESVCVCENLSMLVYFNSRGSFLIDFGQLGVENLAVFSGNNRLHLCAHDSAIILL